MQHVAENGTIDDHAGLIFAEADVVLGVWEKLAVETRLCDVCLNGDDATRVLGITGAAANVNVG